MSHSPAQDLRDRCKRLGLQCDIGIDYAYPHLYRIYVSDGVNQAIALCAGVDTIETIKHVGEALDRFQERHPELAR